MNYKRTTQIPNDIIDIHLQNLNESMLKILLVIIRQTVGYITKKGRRKPTDWITINYFHNRTGLTRKTITKALTNLTSQNLIIALDTGKTELRTAKERQGKKRIYYAYKPYYLQYLKQTCVISSSNMSTKYPITKLNTTKLSHDKISDTERLRQILNSNTQHSRQ